MEQLKQIKSTLIAQVQGQMSNLQCVDANELGQVIDMIKDLEEAIYYCTITEAMEDKKQEESGNTSFYYYMPNNDEGKMYYTEKENKEMMMKDRDRREGKSPISRKTYMEAKEAHMDKATQLKELEKYVQELSSDIVEMIKDTTPEEKQLLQSKMTTLANRINSI